jgi:hypothetical protein
MVPHAASGSLVSSTAVASEQFKNALEIQRCEQLTAF